MINFLRRSLLFPVLWCLGVGSVTKAQIIVTPTAGCTPLTVQFSGPPGASNIHWNLGAGTSNLASPSNLYFSPGTYNITYTAVVQGVPVSYTSQIVVSSPPSASFNYTIPSVKCKPVIVHFNGTGGSPGSQLRWAFGDLSPIITGSAVTYTYNSSGSFTPVMIVVDAVSGCTAVAQNQVKVDVSDPASLVIQGNPGLSSCTGSLTTNISASLSTSGSPSGPAFSSVSWLFSQGTPPSGTGISPGTVAFPSGQHSITLTVTDDNNCTTQSVVPVSVSQPSLSVVADSVQCLGDTANQWKVFSTEPVVYWTVPGGQTFPVTSGGRPDILYYLTTPGLNVFTVTAYPPWPCSVLTQTFSIFAEVLSISYVADTLTSCGGSLALTYTALGASNYSGSVLNYDWLSKNTGYNISVPTQTSGAVVSFSFYQGPSKNPYTIYKEWRPQPLVAVTSQYGCVMTYANDYFGMLHRPTAWFYNDVKEGCAPFVTTFNDSSSASYLYPLQEFTFFTGNGTHSISSTSFSLFPYTYTYTAPGTYSAYMIVKTAGGCIDTSYTQVIQSAVEPTVSMNVASPSVCVGQPVQIQLSVTPSSLQVQYWHVGSEQGIFHGCMNNAAPVSHFNHAGPQTLTLHAVHNGCEGTTEVVNAIMVRGPSGRLRLKKNCTPGQQRTIEFLVQLDDTETAILNFGDGNSVPLSGSVNAVAGHTVAHTFTSSGDYTASLVATNSQSGCGPFTYSLEVTVRAPVARISHNGNVLAGADTFALECEGSPLFLGSDLSDDAFVSCGSGYIWKMSYPGYKFPMEDTLKPVFRNDTLIAGKVYKVVLRIKDVNECLAYDTIHFRMSTATPHFSPNANPICLSTGTMQLFNQSQQLQHRGDSIIASSWDFGNGSDLYVPALPLENPVATYSFAAVPFQVFTVALTVTNNVGCSATFTLPVQVNNPYPALQASTYTACVRTNSFYPVVLSANNGYSNYVFHAGTQLPPVSTSQNSMSVPYYTPGVFVPTVTTTDFAGCQSVDSITVTALGQATPQILSAEHLFCKPAIPVFSANITTFQTVFSNTLWTVGKQTTAPPGMPVFGNQVFTTPGVHQVVLKINHHGYCEDTDTAYIVVADPHAGVKVSKSRLCFGDTISVRVTDSLDVGGWQWFFGDFLPQRVIDADETFNKLFPALVYQYTISPSDSAGRMILALRYHGSMGACPRTATANIQVIDMNTSFSEADGIYRHCLRRTDQFVSQTRNNWGLSFFHDWEFGDNNTGTGTSVSHTYAQPGEYEVRLITRDATLGCRDTAVRTMTVLPLPEASLTISRPLICPGDTITLSGSGKPGESGSLTGTITPAHSFSFSAANDFTLQTTAAVSTTFALAVTDSNDCVSDPASAAVNVMLKPFPLIWDTTVVVGQTVSLNAPYTAGSNFSYTWAPNTLDLSCDTCRNPVSTTTVSTGYTVQVTDNPLRCFTIGHIYRITVLPNTSLDVPSAFTPNGDGINDVIYPEGWGLKRLVYFRVYNRWGQLVYETDDLQKGWDGTFNGEPQNMETYVYQVAAETLLDTVLTKSGSFKLLR